MHFNLVDRVLEQSDDRIVTIKQVSNAEEYLQDHFSGFPVLPGVLMIESMVQAARELLRCRTGREAPTRMVLGGVRAVKYGSFVRPGQSLRIDLGLHKVEPDGSVEFRGEGVVLELGVADTHPPRTAVSGRFTMRPVRLG